jgi:hypothetical protein
VRVLFDHGTPVPLRDYLRGHEVTTAFEIGWSELSNGELLARAGEQFDVFVTTDQQLRYQQNIEDRTIAVLVLPLLKLDQAGTTRSNDCCRGVIAAARRLC